MNCTIHTTVEALDALAPAWLDLLGRSNADAISLTPLWLATWWRTFGTDRGRSLRIATFTEGDRLVGVAPLTLRRHWYRPALPFRRLEFLGTGEREHEAICGDYYNVIAEAGREEQVARAFADAVCANRFGRWDELFLETLAGDSPMLPHLAAAFNGTRHAVTVEEYDQSRYVTLPPTFDDYLKLLGKHRKPSQQALRYLDEWGPWELQIADNEATLQAGWAILMALHTSRWAGTGKGTFAAPRFLAFHEQLLPRLLAEGKLQLAWLTANGQPIAAAYNIIHGGKVWYYQTGRRMDVPAKIRPGVVLLLHLIRDAIEKGLREFDFLPGEAQYKDHLGTASRPIVRLRVARPTWVETLRVWSRQVAARWRSRREK